MKGVAEFLWFFCKSMPAEGMRQDAFWHHLTLVLVWLPTVHSAGLLLYSDRFTCGTSTIYLLQQEGTAIYHSMITHLASPVISEIDALDVVVDLPLWPCTCCLSHRQSFQIPAAVPVTHCYGVPLGCCTFAAQMYSRLTLLFLMQT